MEAIDGMFNRNHRTNILSLENVINLQGNSLTANQWQGQQLDSSHVICVWLTLVINYGRRRAINSINIIVWKRYMSAAVWGQISGKEHSWIAHSSFYMVWFALVINYRRRRFISRSQQLIQHQICQRFSHRWCASIFSIYEAMFYLWRNSKLANGSDNGIFAQ